MNLTKEDMLIFWRCTNDIIWNNSPRGIRKTHNSLTDNRHNEHCMCKYSIEV